MPTIPSGYALISTKQSAPVARAIMAAADRTATDRSTIRYSTGLHGYLVPTAVNTGYTAPPTGDPGRPLTKSQTATNFLSFRGTWVANTAYAKNSVVVNGSATYIAVNAVPARATFTAGDWQAS